MKAKCANCGRSKYEHHDHDHITLSDYWGRCPFGDCGNFKPEQDA